MIALAIIICVFVLLLIVPKRSYPWAMAAAVPTYASLCWIITRPLPVSNNWGSIDRAIISIALFFGIIPLLFRWLLIRRSDAQLQSEVDWTPAKASCLFVAVWGGAWLLTPVVPSIVGAATCITVGLVLSLAALSLARRVPRHRGMFITAGAALITGVIAILIWPLTVVTAAEMRAAGKPYCLVVAHGANYRTANNLLELTPIVMRGRESGSSALNYHAELLITGEVSRNWSYDHGDFVDQSSDHTAPSCITLIGFARKLPWF